MIDIKVPFPFFTMMALMLPLLEMSSHFVCLTTRFACLSFQMLKLFTIPVELFFHPLVGPFELLGIKLSIRELTL